MSEGWAEARRTLGEKEGQPMARFEDPFISAARQNTRGLDAVDVKFSFAESPGTAVMSQLGSRREPWVASLWL